MHMYSFVASFPQVTHACKSTLSPPSLIHHLSEFNGTRALHSTSWSFGGICYFEAESHFVAQASLKLTAVFSPHPLSCLDYKRAPPHPGFPYLLYGLTFSG